MNKNITIVVVVGIILIIIQVFRRRRRQNHRSSAANLNTHEDQTRNINTCVFGLGQSNLFANHFALASTH